MSNEPKDKYAYIRIGINISNLVKSTLGPKGMNKMVVDEKSGKIILTNDGATIIKNIKVGNPLGEPFKKLAVSQEKAIGDGTTTATILVGQLLEKAIDLLEKNIHPSVIISGYNVARNEAISYIEKIKKEANSEQIIKTCLGSKVNPYFSQILTKIFSGKTINKDALKTFKKENHSIDETELIKGYMFDGYTLNDRVKLKRGKIAVLDTRANLELKNYNITSSDELEKINHKEREYKRKIVNRLKESGVTCAFISDTNPEFEAYLTEKGIVGIPVFKREQIDNLCRATGAIAISSIEDFNEKYLGEGTVSFEKDPLTVKVISDKSTIDTLILAGPTTEVLDEAQRAGEDVVGLLQHGNNVVTGAGAIEIDLSNFLEELSKKVGGKEQIAVKKFAEAVESIPLILAENSGLDAMEIVAYLKSAHLQGNENLGIDILRKVSDAKERGIIEPAIMKQYAIGMATDVANLILKLDEILVGEDK